MKERLNSKMLIFALIIAYLFAGCKNVEQPQLSDENRLLEIKAISETQHAPRNSIQDWEFRYDITQPEKCDLPKDLVEISALTIDNRSDALYAVNDEKAHIYGIEDCKESSKFDFGKNGDYEGIELVGDQMFVLKSSGRIIQYDLALERTIRVIRTPLKSKNNTEGLGYDSERNILLIACKESPSIDKGSKSKKVKAVYAYDLDTDKFIDKPVLLIEDDQLESYILASDKNQYSKKERKRRLHRVLDFSPSAIAKCPSDSYYYLLSTVGKTLVIIDSKSKIIDVQFLDHPSFIQPEGICFNASGDMFISNEGKGLVSNILRLGKK